MSTVDESLDNIERMHNEIMAKSDSLSGFTKNENGGYSVDYNDQRFIDIQNEQANKEAQTNETYNNMINESDKYYNNQIDAAKDYAQQQSELQQANTDFAIQQIEQEKEQAQKDYTKEQKGAYSDYMKKTKSDAQNMANSGLRNTGYSESSEVSIYNAYQNRVATAKDSLNRSLLNFSNSIQQARLANNEKLAEIAYNALQMENELNQRAFEYKNNLILQRESALERINEMYYQRYQDVLSQINNEIALQMEIDRIDREYEQWITEFTEQIRQQNLAHERWQKEFDANREQWQKEYDLKERQIEQQIRASQAEEAYHYAQIRNINTAARSSNPYSNTSNNNDTEPEGSRQAYNAAAGSIRELQQIMRNPAGNNSRANAQQGLDRWKQTIANMGANGQLSRSQQEQLYSLIANG